MNYKKVIARIILGSVFLIYFSWIVGDFAQEHNHSFVLVTISLLVLIGIAVGSICLFCKLLEWAFERDE